ncbi:methyltransferase domain-containing protein [Rheinheimera mesophila]|uniref:Methyltransferase domain-containing protein n=1 Tax=Rheinheimera mesophila TaxID=1547515 RepID=A0A3P3QPL7_9GAMM|nr:class I SAM-dependent methyltransferase [Rheinheimera mesophila]KKL01555.1 methyltransferase [Rheinheimera mesophila]RRJ23206.1 methyltransferase domain-containing protein [Rheinheimera mesophila]
MSTLCPVCLSNDLKGFVHRDQIPVHQNLVMTSVQQAKACHKGDLDFSLCASCGFLFNRAFDLSALSYGDNYDNTQSHSPMFERYMDELVSDLVENQGVRNCTVVEVGCGKGVFLKKLISYPGANNKGIGFDPSYVGEVELFDGKLKFVRQFYDASCAEVAADVVICRHVIEHVPSPLELLHSVRAAITNRPHAKIFFETPCVNWILKNKVVWDFFYEHCSLFSKESLSTAFELAGFQVTDVRHIFEGQYLWLTAVPAQDVKPHFFPALTLDLAQRYKQDETALLNNLAELVARLSQNGGVALWGAGAKGATLAYLLDPNVQTISAVIDVNPNKQGKFLPGSGHPIISPASLKTLGLRNAVLMNPNYRAEIEQLLIELQVTINLHEWSAS